MANSQNSYENGSTAGIAHPDTSVNSINKQQQQITSAICESCIRLETEVKKLKADCAHLKQIENELRQKVEVNSGVKNSLQAKQKENEELDKRYILISLPNFIFKFKKKSCFQNSRHFKFSADRSTEYAKF